MRNRTGKGKYAPFIAEFAEVYAKNGRNGAATARAIRRKYPKFQNICRRRLSDWMGSDCHGFAGEVKAAEEKLIGKEEVAAERWFEEEAVRLERRKRQLEAQFEVEWNKGRQTKALGLDHEITKLSRLICHLHKSFCVVREGLDKGKDEAVDRYRDLLLECASMPGESRPKSGDDSAEAGESAEESTSETDARVEGVGGNVLQNGQ